jgi:diguanylate cyclase (GGDEF)-like protein
MFEDRFEPIFKAQAEAGLDLSVVMIDVDNFKLLNDTLGHKAGDELLKFIGELLKSGLRQGDVAVRYGGDEFVLILPSARAEDAERVAQRTIAMFGQQAKLIEVERKPSMSAGVASLHKHRAPTAEGLWRMADEALYESKRSGKAQVRVYDPTQHTNRQLPKSKPVHAASQS